MKTISNLRPHVDQAVSFATPANNLQEVQPVNKTTVSVTSDVVAADRPHLLAKRSARWARRTAH